MRLNNDICRWLMKDPSSSPRSFAQRHLFVMVVSFLLWYGGGLISLMTRAVFPGFNVHGSVLPLLVFCPAFPAILLSEAFVWPILIAEIPLIAFLTTGSFQSIGKAAVSVLIVMALIRIPNLMIEDAPVWGLLYVPVLACGALPLYWRHCDHRRRKRKKLGLCAKCGYDLRASKERCSECGAAIEKSPADGRPRG